MAENESFKYYAFISYNSKDQKWGKRLQRKLESFKLPSTLCGTTNHKKRPFKPVFFAPTDIQPGSLSEELQERLKASEYLIVICSPNSAKSQWVGREIEYFCSLGRASKIQFFIVDGIPNSGNPETECFNPVLKKLDIPEILGANIHEKIYKSPWLNRERAYVQLISKLLGVEFDSIWNRHKRMMVNRILAIIILFLVLAGLVVWLALSSRPVDVAVSVAEKDPVNANLPPLDNVAVTLILENETKVDSFRAPMTDVVFKNIPKKYLNKPVRFVVQAPDFLPLDTTLELKEAVALQLERDASVFGHITFGLWDIENEQGIGGVKLKVAGIETVSDSGGYVRMNVPLANQRTEYTVETDLPVQDSILRMPTSDNTVILVFR